MTCPVTLWAATSEAETVRFSLINRETNNRINMVTVDAGTREEVERADLVKGFQVAKNEYVLFTKEELDSVKIESTKMLDIEKCVPRSSIDRLYWDTPYYLVPSGWFVSARDERVGPANSSLTSRGWANSPW